MRKIALLLISALITFTFTSCDKETDDSTFTGTTWKAKLDDASFELRFVNDTICTLMSGRNGLYSANKETYLYERGIGIDIFMYKNKNYTECVGNFISNKTFKLTKVVDGLSVYEYPVFEKQKNN
jgi:hypothetical protein